jgi:hypothetical protein
MKPPICGVVLLAATVVCSPAHSEIIAWDDLLRAYVDAGDSITKGDDRRAVLERLETAIRENPNSGYRKTAERLAKDLAGSVDQLAKRQDSGIKLEDAPEEYLMDTKVALYLIAYPANAAHLARILEQDPRDPVAKLIARGRSSIDRLIPKLSDDSPARLYSGPFTGPQSVTTIPRVSDVALHLIEHLTGCKFHFNASTAIAFHQLSEEVRETRVARIKEWWRENKDKSVADGIRSQLPHAEFYEQVQMAKSLIRVADREKNEADREFGIAFLREKLDGDIGYTAAHTARALAEFGDMSGIEYFYKQWKESLRVPGRYYSMESEVAWYLMDHGGRREWELVNEIARRELREERSAETAAIWSALVYGTKSKTSPYAIPGLGLALTQRERFHQADAGEARFATQAYRAAEYLQALTSADFGYDPKGSEQEKLAALKRAQKWWAEEGQAKYTFDYIEQHLVKKNHAGNESQLEKTP